MNKIAVNYRFSIRTLRMLSDISLEYNKPKTGVLEELVIREYERLEMVRQNKRGGNDGKV